MTGQEVASPKWLATTFLSHVPGWAASPYAELVAGSDVNPAVFPAWKEKHGVAKFYEDSMDLINDPELDIIDICTPNMYHAPLAIAALDAGKHVICEKPLAPTPDEVRQMIAARDRAGKLLMTAQHLPRAFWARCITPEPGCCAVR
jgi:predicted dehydrogenase